MRVRQPLRDQIARNLKAAMDRMDPDLERVEFWAAALEGFMQPVPAYEPIEGEYLLHTGAGPRGARASSFATAFPDRR
jgi:hypothetical protein